MAGDGEVAAGEAKTGWGGMTGGVGGILLSVIFSCSGCGTAGAGCGAGGSGTGAGAGGGVGAAEIFLSITGSGGIGGTARDGSGGAGCGSDISGTGFSGCGEIVVPCSSILQILSASTNSSGEYLHRLNSMVGLELK